MRGGVLGALLFFLYGVPHGASSSNSSKLRREWLGDPRCSGWILWGVLYGFRVILRRRLGGAFICESVVGGWGRGALWWEALYFWLGI